METEGKNVIARLAMTLKTDGDYFNMHKASILQGVIMQQIRSEYAQVLHLQGLKPYSQYCWREGEDVVWVIQALNTEAYQEILLPLMQEAFREFYIEHDKQKVLITEKKLEMISMEKLIGEFYDAAADKYFKLEFLTPTAFKIDGKYAIFPDPEHIFASCMRKMDAIAADQNMFSEETLEQITEVSEITEYQLRSVRFEAEGVKIPAFVGRITIAVRGNQTMRNFVKLLLSFSEYSGVGIKTAMGMGAVRLLKRKEEWGNDRKRV